MKVDIACSIMINADIESVFRLVKDFKHWGKWSPWSVCEPDHKNTVSGKAGEKGHQMRWDGKVIGSGTITISELSGHRLDYDLEFLKPQASKATSAIHLEKTSAKKTIGDLEYGDAHALLLLLDGRDHEVLDRDGLR